MSDELPRVYLTYEEAAKMLAYKSTRTVQRKVAAGELEARGKGKGKRIVYASVLAHPDYGRTN
jgi:excisionase family DNA binding protein